MALYITAFPSTSVDTCMPFLWVSLPWLRHCCCRRTAASWKRSPPVEFWWSKHNSWQMSHHYHRYKYNYMYKLDDALIIWSRKLNGSSLLNASTANDSLYRGVSCGIIEHGCAREARTQTDDANVLLCRHLWIRLIQGHKIKTWCVKMSKKLTKLHVPL